MKIYQYETQKRPSPPQAFFFSFLFCYVHDKHCTCYVEKPGLTAGMVWAGCLNLFHVFKAFWSVKKKKPFLHESVTFLVRCGTG